VKWLFTLCGGLLWTCTGRAFLLDDESDRIQAALSIPTPAVLDGTNDAARNESPTEGQFDTSITEEEKKQIDELLNMPRKSIRDRRISGGRLRRAPRWSYGRKLIRRRTDRGLETE
jgi:hypothetical protein